MQFQNIQEKILIIDFGSQVTKLIARRMRDLGVYSEIITPNEIKKLINFETVKGIILSGGPSTVTKNNHQTIPKNIFSKTLFFWSNALTLLHIVREKGLSNQKWR